MDAVGVLQLKTVQRRGARGRARELTLEPLARQHLHVEAALQELLEHRAPGDRANGDRRHVLSVVGRRQDEEMRERKLRWLYSGRVHRKRSLERATVEWLAGGAAAEKGASAVR